MKRWGLLLIMFGWLGELLAQEPHQNPIFNNSVMSGNVGDTPVHLFLAPSPHIARGVVDFINAATGSLDVCVYEINLPEIVEAIAQAVKRNVKVRFVVPPSTLPSKDDSETRHIFNDLLTKKILRLSDNRSGLMHNKFMVADRHRVWTGSCNFSQNDTEMNDNNAVTFSNDQMARNFTAEMDEIWEGNHGRKKGTPTPFPEIQMGNVLVRNLFSPEDDLEKAFVEEVLKATNSIFIMAFALTDRAILDALKNRITSGVKVYVLLDLTLSRQGSSLKTPLIEAGATVRISSNNGRMHHKVMVIDDNVVITGSANFSASALKVNDENIVIFACPPLARAFTREFTRCWRAQPYWVNKWSQDTVR
jgi:phosphatidylserine/phosphatidylglycerophosphate/cardiolipin synthase-like enzyme